MFRMAIVSNLVLSAVFLFATICMGQPLPRPGLAPLCALCNSNAQCETSFCVLGVCLGRGSQDISECLRRPMVPTRSVIPFPRGSRGGLAACQRCTENTECANGLQCSGRPPICHDGQRGSLRACRRRERPSATDCPRCPAVPPLGMLLGPLPDEKRRPDCAPCFGPEDCGSNYCSFGLCGPPGIAARCLLPECRQCDRDSQCVTGKCWHEVCTYGTVDSLIRCGYTPPCGPCSSDDMCSTMECSRGVCVAGRNSRGLLC